MPRVEYKTKVIMDNGKVYEFAENLEQFLKRIFDGKNSKLISTYLKGEGFYINTEHISSIEEAEDSDLEARLRKVELDQMAVELRKLVGSELD